jgi:hypothetical protein
MIRNNMPYVAWLRIVPAVKMARLEGLFGDWIGHTPHGKHEPTYKMEVGKNGQTISL